MKAETEKQTLVKLKGQLERVTFENEENAYTVAKIKVYGYSDLVTIVGNISSPTPGEILSLSGECSSDIMFGEQFKVVFCSCEVPPSVDGIDQHHAGGARTVRTLLGRRSSSNDLPTKSSDISSKL